MPEPDAAIDSQVQAPTPEPTTTVPASTNLTPPPAPPSAIQGSIDKGQVTGAPVQAPIPPHVSRLAQIGHVASTLLGNQPGQKPGDVFRHIVAGAILGGMAGAGSRNFGEGLGRGGEAVVSRNDQQAKVARDQKQREFENQRQLRTESREDTVAQAQIAHMHISDLHADAQMDLMQQEHVDKLNQYNNSVLDVVKEKGSPSRIMVNGQDINATSNNGNAFAAAYAKNPRLFDAPEGYYRVHSQTVDNSGLTYKVGQGWVDAEGKSVDMSTRTTHHFYDIPKSVMGEHIQKTGKEWNSIAGYKAFSDDDKMHDGTLSDVMGLKTLGVKNSIEQNKADLEKQQIRLEIARVNLENKRILSEVEKGNRSDMLAAYEANKLVMDGAKAKLKDADFTDPEEKKQALADMAEATSNLRAIQEKLYPKTAVPVKPAGAVDISALQKQVPWDTAGPSDVAFADKSGKFVGFGPRSLADKYKSQKGYTEIPRPDSAAPAATAGTASPGIVVILSDGFKTQISAQELINGNMPYKSKIAPESQKAYDDYYNKMKQETDEATTSAPIG